MKALTSSLVLCALLISSGANATLVGSADGKTVWDADMSGGITWLSNANLAATETFGVSGIMSDGKMTWTTAQNWIGAMNTANYLGYHDWRLPTTLQPDASCANNGGTLLYNCTGSEMGHLFYNEFGNKGLFAGYYFSYPIGVYGLVDDPTNPNDESLFTNLQSDAYWSGTEYTSGESYPWTFYFSLGGQRLEHEYFSNYALAVRDGEVAAVPVPAAAWLLGSGLLGLIGVARRNSA